MATQVQFRRGTTTQNNAFTGAIGEITYDTQVKTLRLHDGSTAGGGAVVTINAGSQTLTNKTMSTNSVWQGTAVGLAYGGTAANLTAVAGGVLYSGSSALAISAAGTSGQVLTSAGSSAPTWTAQSSLTVGTATTATTASNINGGSAGYLVYQVDTNDTAFIAPGATGYVLQSTGASTAPSWVTSDLTIGSTAVTLGTTVTSFAGITSLDGTSGSTSYFATPTSPVLFAGATTLTIGYGSTASSTTNISTGAVGSGNTKTINIGTGSASGSTTNINLGDADGGTVTVNKDLVVSGDLTVNGTTTTVNSTTLDVDDINITIAKGAANAAAANGAGLTVDGASATILYTSATDSWNFNKPLKATNTDYWLIPVGNIAARPGTPVNGMIRYNSEISAFEGYASSAWSSLGGVKSVDGYTYILAETSAGNSNGDLDFYAEASNGTSTTQVGQWNRTNLKDYTGTLVGTQTTQNVFNATATTVNAFGAATTLTIGATSGTATIRNSTVAITNAATVGSTLAVTGATTLTGALAANGGITVDSTNFTVDGTTGAVSTASNATVLGNLELGHASDTTIARSAAGVVTIEGVEIVTLSRSQTLTNKTLTSPTMTTPTLGVASATSINKVAITAPATSATLTIADGKTLTASNTLTFTGTDASSVAFGTGGTVAYTANKLSVFAATTSSELAGVISDETGSGALVFANTPTLVTPNIGAATGTSLTATGGGVLVRAASTQDGIEIRGRAGGTGNWEVILTPTTLTADRTFTFPDHTGTILSTGSTSTSVQFGSFGVGTAASGTTGEIRATNAITSFYSDERLKTDITEISGALDKVMQLRGVTFRANELAESYGYNSDKEQVGVIAQDVEKVLPQIVVPAPFDLMQLQEGIEISRSGENYKTVHYEKLVPLLIQAIKEQQVMIEELQKKVG